MSETKKRSGTNIVLEALDKIALETPTTSPEDMYLIVPLKLLVQEIPEGIDSETTIQALQAALANGEVSLCVKTPEGPARIPLLLVGVLVAIGAGDGVHVCDLRKQKQLVQSN